MTNILMAKLVVFLVGAFLTLVGLGTGMLAYSTDEAAGISSPQGKTAVAIGGLLVMLGVFLGFFVLMR